MDKLKNENAAYREEKDIQRQAIQDLSAQVDKLQKEKTRLMRVIITARIVFCDQCESEAQVEGWPLPCDMCNFKPVKKAIAELKGGINK